MEGRCPRRRRLWADPQKAAVGVDALRVRQLPLLPLAEVSRGRARRRVFGGGRPHDGRHGHADGRGAGRRAHPPPKLRAHLPRHDGRDVDGRPRHRRRRRPRQGVAPDGGGAVAEARAARPPAGDLRQEAQEERRPHRVGQPRFGDRAAHPRVQPVAGLLPGWETARPGTLLALDRAGPIVRCHDTALQLLEVKPEGSSRMDGGAFARGRPFVALKDEFLPC